MSGRCSCSVLALCLLLAPPVCAGQTELRRPEPSLDVRIGPAVRPRPIRSPVRDPISRPIQPDSGLRHIARAAGMIFSGTVIRIEPRAATGGQSVETVAVTFRVENALRGTTAGRSITISQWFGVWAAGQNYRLGERVLLFLYPRSSLGLTSLVAGPLGRFDVESSGYIRLSARHMSAFRIDPVLGGKSRVSFSDFASAVRHACEEE